MKKTVLLLCMTLLFGGCVAYVDDTGQYRRVKSVLITNDEVLDMMEEMDKTPSQEKNEYQVFGGSGAE